MSGSSSRNDSRGAEIVARAHRLEREGRLDEAVELLRPLVESASCTADASYRFAHLRLAQGRWVEAENWLRRALELRFEDSRSHTNLGIVLDLQGRREEAVRAFRRAIQVEPSEPAAYLNLGALYGEMGRHEDAVRYLERSLSLAPSFDATFNLALVHIRKGHWLDAEPLLRQALHHRQDHALTHYYLGLCLSKRGLLDQAAHAFESALALDREFVGARHRLGTVYRRLGRGRDAVRVLESVARSHPDDPQVLRELGLAYDFLSEKSESLKCFRRARMLDAAGGN
jgi:tetratricopeptide (TPR) repeat protein